MAEHLPPTLDDGELWLPSDFNGVRRNHQHSLNAMDDLAQKLASFDLFDHRFAAMDDLSQKLGSLNLLDHRRAIPTAEPLKEPPFSPDVQFQGQGKPIYSLSTVNVGFKPPMRRRAATAAAFSGERSGPFFPVSKTVHKYYPALSADLYENLFERFGMARVRARILQRLRLLHDNESNQFLLTRSAGLGRKSSGTGVFLPKLHRVDSKKKSSSFNEKTQIHETMWKPAMGKQEAKLFPPSEMGLPQDWTY